MAGGGKGDVAVVRFSLGDVFMLGLRLLLLWDSRRFMSFIDIMQLDVTLYPVPAFTNYFTSFICETIGFSDGT